MNNLWMILLLGMTLQPQFVTAQSGSEKEEYRLIWSDEFEGQGVPDSSVWSFEEGFVRNQELQWYQKENAHL